MTYKECIDGMQRIIDEDRNKILVRVHVGYLIHAVKYLKEQLEIVRCKDCVFRDDRDGMCEHVQQVRDPEWYCADGERSDKS